MKHYLNFSSGFFVGMIFGLIFGFVGALLAINEPIERPNYKSFYEIKK